MIIRPLALQSLREQYIGGTPFPFVKIENFLGSTFAEEVAAAYPAFENALSRGKTFTTVNERKKIQITDAKLFPRPVAKLNEALASPKFLSDLSFVTGIPDLVADEELVGGGMHVTGPGGRLDVHVDFNFMENRQLHRRLNLLLYLNPVWEEQWGGQIQLWDEDVKQCLHTFTPAFNRCVIFETSEISFHGVTPVMTNAPGPRISFATYYYTREPPPNWTGIVHGTVFKARPEELLRRYALMPAEAFQRRLAKVMGRIKQHGKRLLTTVR
jgi:2OG-Fe(II) oxygenase superfamily